MAQAMDAAQRHVARNPDDPRGARLLAGFEMEQGRAAAAAATLQNIVGRGRADAETFDMLGRAQLIAGRPRDAVEAFRRAVEAQPNNAAFIARLAAARFAIGDMAGMAEAAQASLNADANAPGARLMLGLAALGRGDAAQAEAELAQLDAEQRRSEAARVLAGMIKLLRFDPPGARTDLEAVLRDLPESVSARLALARVASVQGRAEEAERLLADVLQRDPANQEALARLAATALAGGPRAETARNAILRAQAAAPREAGLAFTAANLLAATGDLDRATALLRSDALRGTPALAAGAQLRLSELRAGREDFAGAEEAARAALAESPTLAPARRQLALLLARRGDARAAENLIEEGLRGAPADPVLLGAAVGVAQQLRGVDGGLAMARQLQRRPGAMPAAAPLAGDVLMGAQRPAEAAEAYAAAARDAPSQALLLRQANALAAADRRADAQALLEAWATRNPQDGPVQSLLGQFELQAGRGAAAEQRFRAAVAASPQDALALNNLAWLLQERSPAGQLAEAQALAERAFFLAPSAEIADTLGWILARRGEAERAVPLLRQSAAGAAAGRSPQAPGMAYRFASALNGAGQREEALRVLEAALQGDAAFPERADAERLLATLRAGR
jgi:putative PEP-CTERM system TPR-repeat lipoprotein